jgi:hypothetical protein
MGMEEGLLCMERRPRTCDPLQAQAPIACDKACYRQLFIMAYKDSRVPRCSLI